MSDDLKKHYAGHEVDPEVPDLPCYRKSGPPVPYERAKKYAANIERILRYGVSYTRPDGTPIGRTGPELDEHGKPTREAELRYKKAPSILRKLSK